jgi:PPOX class probable F420-dependent enzyme
MTAKMTAHSDEKALLELLGSRHRGVFITIKRDGMPQLSNVDYTYDPGTRMLRFSVTDGRAKTVNLRRDPRASFHVTTALGGSYAVAEGIAELSPVASDPADATVEELVELFRAIRCEHPDWQEYRNAMVTDRRLVIRLSVQRVYGWMCS